MAQKFNVGDIVKLTEIGFEHARRYTSRRDIALEIRIDQIDLTGEFGWRGHSAYGGAFYDVFITFGGNIGLYTYLDHLEMVVECHGQIKLPFDWWQQTKGGE